MTPFLSGDCERSDRIRPRNWVEFSLGVIMRAACLFACALLSAIIYAEDQSGIEGTTASDLPKKLAGLWVVRIENLQHQVVTTMTIEFTGDQAKSCMSGDWKRVVVKSHDTSDRHFFPVTEPLSYELENGSLVIGKNEWCDDYLHLKGDFRDSAAHGEYVAFGLGGGRRLGYFSLSRSPS